MKLLLLSIVVLINLFCDKPTSFKSKIYPSDKLDIKYQQDWQKTPFNNRVNDFRNEPIGYNKIVFLGNSIIEAGNNWNEKFGVDNIVNRGISGDFTEGVLARLDEIIYYKPLAVFILIGINSSTLNIISLKVSGSKTVVVLVFNDVGDSVILI